MTDTEPVDDAPEIAQIFLNLAGYADQSFGCRSVSEVVLEPLSHRHTGGGAPKVIVDVRTESCRGDHPAPNLDRGCSVDAPTIPERLQSCGREGLGTPMRVVEPDGARVPPGWQNTKVARFIRPFNSAPGHRSLAATAECANPKTAMYTTTGGALLDHPGKTTSRTTGRGPSSPRLIITLRVLSGR